MKFFLRFSNFFEDGTKLKIPSEFKPLLLSGEGNSSLAECNFGCLVTFVDIP